MKRWGIIAMMALAFAGLADSLYLAQHEVTGDPLLCTIQNLTGCNIVANSVYSHIFGIPVAVFAVVLYALVFGIAALELLLLNPLLRRLLQGLALLDLLIAIFSTAIQVFLIQALCIYCLASSVIAVLLFILASRIEPLRLRRAVVIERVVIETTESLPMPPA